MVPGLYRNAESCSQRMPNYTCPACRQTFHASDDPDAPCVICGHKLSQFAVRVRFHAGDFDLVEVARGQRWLLRSLLFAMGGQALFYFGPPVVVWGYTVTFLEFLPTLVLMAGVYKIVHAVDEASDKALVSAMTMFIPIINIVVLIAVNSRAGQVLRSAGLHVGILGAPHEMAEAAMDPTKCKSCGYDLTGNASGVCSECGKSIRDR